MNVVLAWLSVVLLGCRCGEPPAPRTVRAPHYGEWDRMVDVAIAGDLDSARIMARDLTEGDVVDPDDEHAATVGAALGFLQIGDREDLPTGIGKAAKGCGDCHAAAGIEPLSTPRPPFSHHDAARWAVWGLVWNDAEAPPSADDEVLSGLQAAWARQDTGPAPSKVDRTVALLEHCHGCHGSDRRMPLDMR